MSKYEWVTNQHRDALSSHIEHVDQLACFAAAENQSMARARLQFVEKMMQPCGP